MGTRPVEVSNWTAVLENPGSISIDLKTMYRNMFIQAISVINMIRSYINISLIGDYLFKNQSKFIINIIQRIK